MSVAIAAGESVSLAVGQVWNMAVTVTDFDGVPSETEPVLTVTDPAGTTSTPAVTSTTAGLYAVFVVVDDPGRWIASWVTAYGTATCTAYATAIVTEAGMPDRAEFKDYAGITDTARDDEIDKALLAEAGAQRAVCRVPAAYPADLREALLRRVARNLALRLLPLAVLRGDGEAGSDTVLPGRDPEIRRLEAPYRRRKVG